MRPTIIDTDLGTDADDVLAVALILGSPELNLVGITTIYGDTALRAQLAAKLLKVAGIDRIHQKIEDARFLSWADRLGLLGRGKGVSSHAFSEQAVVVTTTEWMGAVRQMPPPFGAVSSSSSTNRGECTVSRTIRNNNRSRPHRPNQSPQARTLCYLERRLGTHHRTTSPRS